ncbi:hypothetical protein NMY22_g3916 [Coprinellus aureogranulatus]|nr:hypothetical protein NMY22_g3916 [Coprinellus aureogranulatus]
MGRKDAQAMSPEQPGRQRLSARLVRSCFRLSAQTQSDQFPLNRKWIISENGYANIVASPGDYVYGLVYELSEADEAHLDRSEGVPYNYTKELLSVEFALVDECLPEERAKVVRQVMAYVNRERTVPGEAWEEYIGKVNNGILDGVKYGIPEGYVEKYFRPFIPPPTGGSDLVVRDSLDPHLADTLRFALSTALSPAAR